jgi:hypothetical protein
VADVSATSPPPPVDYDRLGKALGMGGMQQTLREDRAKVDALEPSAPRITPPPLNPPPTDPLQAFGQPAMWLAALGGLLTRHPLTSAIQSAGAVMDSVHKQDDAAAQRALAEWKINSENAMKMVKYEQDAYKAALAKYSTDARAGEAEIRTLAGAFRNAALQKVYEEEGMDGVVRYLKKSGSDGDKLPGTAKDLNDHLVARTNIASGLASGDPGKQADALDLYATELDKSQSGKGSSATSRENVLTVGVKLRAIAEMLRSGDPQKIAQAQQEATSLPELGPGVLKPPKAPTSTASAVAEKDAETIAAVNLKQKNGEPVSPEEQRAADEAVAREAARLAVKRDQSAATTAGRESATQPKPQTTPWITETDPATNKQFRTRTNAEGKPEYQNMAGETIEPPSGAIRTPKTATPGSLGEERQKRFEEMKTAQQNAGTYKDDTSIYRAMDHQMAEDRQTAISDEAAKTAADIALKTGHPPAWMGRSQASLTKFLDMYSKEAKAQGLGPDEIAANQVKFAGELAEARTLGTMSARVDFGAKELDVALPQAMESSERVYRPGFKKIAEIQQAVKGQTSDPDLLEFAQFNQQVISAYAQMMGRGGLSTVHAMDRAEGLLSTATSQTGYMRQLDTLHKEVQTILYGTQASKDQLRQEIGDTRPGVTPPTLTGVPRGASGDAARPSWVPPGAVLDRGVWKMKQPNGRWHAITPLEGQ